MQFHVVCLTPNSRNADIIDYEISLWNTLSKLWVGSNYNHALQNFPYKSCLREKREKQSRISHLHLFDNQVCRLKKLEKNANSCACSAAHKLERLHTAFRIRRRLSFSHCNASESSHFEPQISEVSRSYEEIVNCMTVISTHWPATILQDVCSS